MEKFRQAENFKKKLLDKAKFYFHKVWITEGTLEEIEYYKEYFYQYPNKGNFVEFYNKCLVRKVNILFTNWDYETYTSIYSNKELENLIADHEKNIREEWDGIFSENELIENKLLAA